MCLPRHAQFTFKFINETVEPTHDVTYAYNFKMPADMDPATFRMRMHVFYSDGVVEYSDMFFDQAVNFIKPDELDAGFLLQLVRDALIGAGIVWFLYSQIFAKGKAGPAA